MNFCQIKNLKSRDYFTNLNALLSKINIYIRSNFIISMQIPGPNLGIGHNRSFLLLVAQSQSGNTNENLF